MKGWVLNVDHHEPKKVPHLVGERITQLSSISFIPSADLESVPKSSIVIVSISVKTPNGDVTETPIAIFSALKAQSVRLDLRFLMEEVTISARYRLGKPSGNIVLSGGLLKLSDWGVFRVLGREGPPQLLKGLSSLLRMSYHAFKWDESV